MEHQVPDELAGETLSAALRRLDSSLSWSAAKRLVTGRRVLVNDALSTNDARRVGAGDRVTILDEPREAGVHRAVRLLHIDPDVVVVEKPAGVLSLRPDEERGFSEEKKALQPTLDELVQRLLPGSAPPARKPRRNQAAPKLAPIYVVHRLDRDTSGLMLFALSVRAREAFIDLFTRHAINRTYRAVCLGRLDAPRTFETHIVRDRGDGLRGSVTGTPPADAKRAVTHVTPLEHLGDRYTILECRLETGRTHQIRIHLAEAGHMMCGEKLYTRPAAAAPQVPDPSGAPRQALHSTTLSFTHPITKRELSFDSPWPKDLSAWLERVRAQVT
jgi:23S rRNA pseudouridine1911/1915/1917 synthase